MENIPAAAFVIRKSDVIRGCRGKTRTFVRIRDDLNVVVFSSVARSLASTVRKNMTGIPIRLMNKANYKWEMISKH